MVTCCPVNCKLHLKKILIEKITGKWPTPTIKARRLHFLIFCQCSAVLERIFLCQKVDISIYFCQLVIELIRNGDVIMAWFVFSIDKMHCPKKKRNFPLKISSVNVTKSVVSCGLGHIYWRNPYWKISFFVQWCNKFLQRDCIIHSNNKIKRSQK